MARKTAEEIKNICKELNVDRLWSFSRYDCYKTDRYEYYLKYVINEKEDRENSIYAVAGTAAHDILESLYLGKIKYDDMAEKYEEELFVMNCADLKYNRSDTEKNELIANKYENCMRHFFKNHQVVEHPNWCEKFILIKISDDIYFQGYADFMFCEFINDEKILHIVDYKTSTKYSGAAIESHGKQLMLYAEGMRQLTKLPLENIICEWNFLKYVIVSYEQKNGTIKERYIERNVIGESLVNTAKMWLKHFGYEDKIEEYVDEMILNNDINCLPDEVRSKFKISDCYVQVPLSESNIKSLKQDIIETVSEIKNKENEYSNTKDEKVFWQEVTPGDEFRLQTLSGYSRKLHKPLDEYLRQKEMFMTSESKDIEDDIESKEDQDLLDFLNSL